MSTTAIATEWLAALDAFTTRNDTRQIRAALGGIPLTLSPAGTLLVRGATVRLYGLTIGNGVEAADRFVAVAARVSRQYPTLDALKAALTAPAASGPKAVAA